jgi:hypothetical protein
MDSHLILMSLYTYIHIYMCVCVCWVEMRLLLMFTASYGQSSEFYGGDEEAFKAMSNDLKGTRFVSRDAVEQVTHACVCVCAI